MKRLISNMILFSVSLISFGHLTANSEEKTVHKKILQIDEDDWFSPIRVAYDFSDHFDTLNIALDENDNSETSAIALAEIPPKNTSTYDSEPEMSRAEAIVSLIRSLVNLPEF